MNKMDTYTWTATFSDDSSLSQFDGDTENLFKDVEERSDELVKFRLESTNKTYAEVNLVDGTLLDDKQLTYKLKSLNDVKLLFKKRRQVRGEVGTGKILDARTTYILGLTNKDGENISTEING